MCAIIPLYSSPSYSGLLSEKKKVFDGYDDHRDSANIAQITNTEVKRFLRRVDVSKVPIQKNYHKDV